MKTMLLVFAHPDDESFSSGITIPKYKKSGWNVELICATRGEKGSSGPYEGIAGNALGIVRWAELERASRILGLSSVTFLGYKDGSLKNQQAGDMEDKIYRKMVELAPHIVITFDTTGISNHPDHIRTCYAATYAYQRYVQDIMDTRNIIADANSPNPKIKIRHFFIHHKVALKQEQFADIVESNAVPKLYYACMPASVAVLLKKKGIIPQESFGKPWLGTPDKCITTVIEGNVHTLTKLKALAAHKTQQENVDAFYEEESNPLIKQEFFILRMHGSAEVYMGKGDRAANRL